MLGTKLLPEVLLLGGEHEDEFLDLGGKLPQRVHQDGLTTQGEELLRQVGTHTQATPASDDDSVAMCH